ncbi:MAG: peptide chain release factor N(5)-glutamine methyltransferase [Acidobacteriaceae bacterium]
MFANSLTVGDAVAWGAELLDESDERIKNTRADATLLLRHVLGIPQSQILAYRERPLTGLQTEAFNALIKQRRRGVPIQYLTGEQEFFGLPFHVNPSVLIPRPETEHLVEAAIARLRELRAARIADVGTGSGAVAVALAHTLPTAEVVAVDVSPAALAVAAQNATANAVSDRIRFVESDLLDAVLGESFDAIVSNPPYVAERERKELPKEVRDYEPALALFAGPTGLEFYPRLIAQAQSLLVAGGWLIMEIGHSQRDQVRALLENENWGPVEFVLDLQGIARVAVSRKSF